MISTYYNQSVQEGIKFQKENKSWAGDDTLKYQKHIKSLVDKFQAKTILDYGCGKGIQYSTPCVDNKTFDEWLGVTVYKFDPCVPEFSTPPPKDMKFDGVICSQVLHTIPDADLPWVTEQITSYAEKFVFISLNFKRPAKNRKHIYNKDYFKQPRTRQFFKGFFNNSKNVFWWFKDRMFYPEWIDDQINGKWLDVPEIWDPKYHYVEKIYED